MWQIFPIKKELLKHFKALHHGKAPYKCKKCKKNITTKYALTNHLCVTKIKEKRTNVKPRVMLHCDQCNKTLATSSLRAHVRAIHEQDKSRCEICQVDFTLRYSLTTHNRKFHLNKEHPTVDQILAKIFSIFWDYGLKW